MSVKFSSDKKLLELLSKILHENMGEGKVDVKTLAAQMGISPSQLNRRIKEATGKTTTAYILGIRLIKAKQLLAKYPDVTISEIAWKCGFADVAHFSHVFRRMVKQSPKQYASSLKRRKSKKKRMIFGLFFFINASNRQLHA